MDFYQLNCTDESAEILLYGYIGNGSASLTKQFISDFRKLESTHSIINVRINSGGGDVFEGITIYNTLKNSKSEVHIYIDGLAASMASVIALAGTKLFMSKYAQLMIHKVSGSATGDSQKLRETATLMDDVETSLVDIYASRTGKQPDEVISLWMQRGKDNWFNASEAISNKLVDGVFDGIITKSPTRRQNPEEVWKFYNTQISNTMHTDTDQPLASLIELFSLSASSSHDDIILAARTSLSNLQALSDEVTDLRKQNESMSGMLAALQAGQVTDLIDSAVASGRITESMRQTYTTLASANLEATKSVLKSLPEYKSIASQLAAQKETTEEYATFREYQVNNPKALAEMKSSNPERYEHLFQKEFGISPNHKLF